MAFFFHFSRPFLGHFGLSRIYPQPVSIPPRFTVIILDSAPFFFFLSSFWFHSSASLSLIFMVFCSLARLPRSVRRSYRPRQLDGPACIYNSFPASLSLWDAIILSLAPSNPLLMRPKFFFLFFCLYAFLLNLALRERDPRVLMCA